LITLAQHVASTLAPFACRACAFVLSALDDDGGPSSSCNRPYRLITEVAGTPWAALHVAAVLLSARI